VLPKLAILASVALCLGNAPVAPLAEGTLDGILSAAKAARQCGLKQMRIQIHEEITMIFDEGGPSYGGTKVNLSCFAKWTGRNEKNLAISWVGPSAYDR
jgi:hypothetical protein